MVLKKEVVHYLEALAPRQLQEDYDNSGWQCGDPESLVKSVLLCLDVTEQVLEEAIKNHCNLIISHHPVIFKGIKKITGANYVERILYRAIKNDISIYSIHTNLDAVKDGVNARISERLQLKNIAILHPKQNLQKLVVFCPAADSEKVRSAMCEAGAGRIGHYSECSFTTEGTGSFKANEGADPYVGKKGEIHYEKETKVEVILPSYMAQGVISAMINAHPYEEVAYDLFPLVNASPMVGSGMVGELENEISEQHFMDLVKEKMATKLIRHTALSGRKIKRVAVCGGSGRFLLEKARNAGADVLVTSDFKYHDFFDADGKILVLDIGHFESEQFTMSLLSDWLTKKFNTFAVRITETNTNPVNYY